MSAGGNKTMVSGESHFLEEQMNPTRIKQYLDASRDYEKLKGMKWLLAMMSKGRDASEFFSAVVKNVVVKSVEVKKLVYMYLAQYADATHSCRELALLSINSFQKDLGASNQLIRAMALRVMTSIRVADIIQIQLLAIKKCAADSSPYVRKCAANAVAKIYAQAGDKETLSALLADLLQDSSTMVLGSAVIAYAEVCPEEWSLIHPAYRKLCHLVADVDEWAQIIILQTLTRYVRSQFVDPAPGAAEAARVQAQRRSHAGKTTTKTKITRRTVRTAFYSDEEDESVEEEVDVPDDTTESTKATIADPDHRLALRSSQPLLKSRNSGVVLAVCALHYYCGGLDADPNVAAQCGRALVRILRNKREIQYVVLKSISDIASERPSIFGPFLKEFFVKETDAGFNRQVKLEILTHLATTENATVILRELETYARSADVGFASSAVRAAGRVADAQPDVAHQVCAGLLALVAARSQSPDKLDVVSTALVVVRQLLQQGAGDGDEDDCGRRDVVRRLARLLLWPLHDPGHPSQLKGSQARANVVWLVGEFRECCDQLVPDVVRMLASHFAQEDLPVKQQILNLAVKAALDDPNSTQLQALLKYVLELARFDVNYDLRDRARTFAALLGLTNANVDPKLKALLLQDKRPPLTLTGPVALDGLHNLHVGSLSVMVGHRVDGYLRLPDWPDIAPDPQTRDVAVPRNDLPSAPRSAANVEDDVRDFYKGDNPDDDDDDDEESDEEEESSDDEEEEESDEDDDDDDDDDDDEDDESDDDDEDDDDDEEESDDDDDDDEETDESEEDDDEAPAGTDQQLLSF